MRRLQSQNVRIGMRFLLAGQGEIDGILQGPPHRTYVEIGGLVAIVVLVEGKATARHIDGVQGDSVIREVFLDKIAELDIYRGVCQDTFQRYFRWLHGFDSKRGIFCQTSLPPTAIGTLCLTLRATLCRKEIAGPALQVIGEPAISPYLREEKTIVSPRERLTLKSFTSKPDKARVTTSTFEVSTTDSQISPSSSVSTGSSSLVQAENEKKHRTDNRYRIRLFIIIIQCYIIYFENAADYTILIVRTSGVSSFNLPHITNICICARLEKDSNISSLCS